MQAIRGRPGTTSFLEAHWPRNKQIVSFISHRLGHAYVHLDKRSWALGAQWADQQQTSK
jgi:hypothetical protein